MIGKVSGFEETTATKINTLNESHTSHSSLTHTRTYQQSRLMLEQWSCTKLHHVPSLIIADV